LPGVEKKKKVARLRNETLTGPVFDRAGEFLLA
jgi:hypothetical protein